MTVTYLPKDYDIFFGVDVDKNSFSFTIGDSNNMLRSKKIPSSPEQFHNYIQNNYAQKRVICAYEAGPTGFHLHDYLTEKGIPCLVVAPSSIRKASNARVKNNRIDSKHIAQNLRSGELTSIRVPQGVYRELRHLVSIRETYAFFQKATKQRIKGLLLYANLYPSIKDPDSRWAKRYIEQLKQIKCSDAVRNRLNMLLTDLEYSRKQTLYILKETESFCEKNKDINRHIKYLRSIPGVGFIVSTSLLGRIGDPNNLKNVRELAGFVGLVPSEHSTGDTVNRGNITHLGNQTLRFLLVEAAWVAIRKNTELGQFYHRVKQRHHPQYAAKKAITAVARKLTYIIYSVLKEQRNFIVH